MSSSFVLASFTSKILWMTVVLPSIYIFTPSPKPHVLEYPSFMVVSSPKSTAQAFKIRPGFHKSNYHRLNHVEDQCSSTSKQKDGLKNGWMNTHLRFFSKTRHKNKDMVALSSSKDDNSTNVSSSSDSNSKSSLKPNKSPKKFPESVHLKLQSATMINSLKKEKPFQHQTQSNQESQESALKNKTENDPNENENINEKEETKKVKTVNLHSYTDPITNVTLLGLNIPLFKFYAWVDHELLTKKQETNGIKTSTFTKVNESNRTKGRLAYKASLDINQVATKEIRTDDVEMRSYLREVWRERRLISERTEMLATYASDRNLDNNSLQSNNDCEVKDSDKSPSNASPKNKMKRGGFSDLLHTHTDRLVAIIKDEQDDFDLYTKYQLKHNKDSNSFSILESGALYEWMRREYGDQEMNAVGFENLSKKTEKEQFESLQRFLDWFRSRFPYYYDRCDACGISEKETPTLPPSSKSDDMTDETSSINDEISQNHNEGDDEDDEDDEDDSEIDEDDNAFLGYVYPSEEELKGKATRTEIYWCNYCGAFTRFPRFNSASWIVHKRRGRCGEYSMLLFRMLRVMGFESRWVVDWADHVWSEVKIGGRWVHADPCEAALDQPLLYQDWGKQQNYIVAFNAPSFDFFNSVKEVDVDSKIMGNPNFWNNLEPLIEDVTSLYTSDSIDEITERRDEPIDVIKSSLAKVEHDLKIKLKELHETRSVKR